MSGYNRFEQAVGSVLTRFPRVKRIVETLYQRASYYALADNNFEYELHEDAKLYSVTEWAGVSDQTAESFVGFYDISPWNRSMDRCFIHEVEDDVAYITVLKNGQSRQVATTAAWNYQQGSRTQWHPSRENVLLFNDIDEESIVARMVTADGTAVRTYPQPIHAVNPTGKEFISVNYRRHDRNSPGYGYEIDAGSVLPSPDTDGIFRVGFDGVTRLIVPFAELQDEAGGDVAHDNHYIHHGLYSPDGSRFVFLHRWVDGDRRHTRLLVSDRDGNCRTLLENPYTSHYCWLDAERLFVSGGSETYGRGYHVINIKSGDLSYVHALDGYGDGHPSVSPDGEWIVTDTYPNRLRERSLTLYHLETEQVVPLGTFFAPFKFDGVRRCDLHPRWSSDGRFVSVDSAHNGFRESYVLDVSAICSEEPTSC